MRETTGAKCFRILTIAGLSLFTGLPIFVMASSSLKPLADVQSVFTWWPDEVTIRPYIDMWSTVPLARYFANSLIVAGIATVASVAIAIVAAFVISRFRFRGRGLFTTTVLSTQMFPGILFLLPLFLIFVTIDDLTGLALQGTLTGLTITYLTFSLPFSIWMLVGYFSTIPRALDEAAMCDGCGPIRSLLFILLPAARPGIIAVAIYAFMTAWGEVLFASVMTTEDNRTLAVGLREYSTQTNVYWNEIMAASLVVSVPIVVGFLLAQRHFAAGLTAGAVK